jgi:hypothetical protein
MEKLQMEEIPKDAVPVTKTSLQSSFSWKQAVSAVTTETNSNVSVS